MPRRALGLFAIAAALWGASYLFIKVGLEDGLSEPVIIFVRTALGAIVLVPLGLRAGALPALLERRGSTVALALLQVVIPFGLITWGERWIDSGLAGVLVASAPVFLAMIAPFLAPDESSHGMALVGIVVGIVGVGALFGADLSGDAEALAGGAMVVGAALSYAFAVLLVKRRFAGVPAVGVAASTMVVSAGLWLPAALVSLPDTAPHADAIASMVVLGAGGTGVAFYAFYTLIAEYGPARASLVAYVAPAFAVAYGVVLLDEPLTAGVLIGLVLVLLGSWLAAGGGVSRSGPSRSSAPAPARAR
ncbi:DMT family transporter [Conexibacter sp. SYSU D00693]|uniref:DMT family transporter n=1 Tax=Conexibacter sp. SYSU D00693 TaxID=2812560 RepID=UPI00196B3C76|nr:DMT family transporter [Conexibacter sp. SYSU D00693]